MSHQASRRSRVSAAMIPYGRQSITRDDIDEVIEVLRSPFLTQGPKVPEFEAAICKAVGARCSVAVNSATSALHVAYLSLGVGPGDAVWTSPITFVATANAALYCGASVEFVDIDLSTFNMCVKDLERKLITAKRNNRLPKVVTPVHLCGQSCDMEAIKKLSEEYDFRVVEDASHAIGGRYSGRPIGCCEYSDISVFSFHPVKIITTGEGGVATTNDQTLADSMRLLRSHGITRNEDLLIRRDGDWYYEQQALGFNYRMTEMSAALGCSQLKRLEVFVQSRNELAAVYDSELASLPLHLPEVPPNVVSSRHLYVVRLKAKEHVINHAEIFHALRKFGVGVNLHYIPVYRQPYYSKLAISKQDFVNSETYYESAISIPLFHDMTQQDQETVINALKVVLA